MTFPLRNILFDVVWRAPRYLAEYEQISLPRARPNSPWCCCQQSDHPSNGSHTCSRQNIPTSMLQWRGGKLWILSRFFLSPYSSLIILVEVDLCLICDVLSWVDKLDLLLKHTGGTLVKPSLPCWRWHRPTSPSGSGQLLRRGFSWLPLLSPTLLFWLFRLRWAPQCPSPSL